MLKKIYLFIIPCCLIISEADACDPLGHVNFYNDTPIKLHIKVKKVRPNLMVCFTKPKRIWSEGENKKCSEEMEFSYEDITLLPGGKGMGVCWYKNNFIIVDFNVTYKDNGIMHAGPKGTVTGFDAGGECSCVSIITRRGGDQTTIKSSECLPFASFCQIHFSLTKRKKSRAQSWLKKFITK